MVEVLERALGYESHVSRSIQSTQPGPSNAGRELVNIDDRGTSISGMSDWVDRVQKNHTRCSLISK